MKCFSLLLLGFFLSFTSLAIPPITGTTQVCAGSTTLLSDATTGGIWSSSNTAAAPVSPTGVVSGLLPGTAAITYAVGAARTIVTVTVNPLPAVYMVTGGGGYCIGDSGVHIGLSGSQIGVSYQLAFGSLVTGPVSGTTLPLDFGLQTIAGTYTVSATVLATGCGSAMSGSATVIINPLLPVSVSIAAVPGDTVCSGTSTTFTAIPVNGGTTPVYKWQVNGTHIGTDTSFYTYVPGNGDIVTITLVSDTACAMPDTVTSADTVTVMARVTPVVSISAAPDTEVCQGSPVILTALPVYGGASPAYKWIKNGVIAFTGAAYTFTPVNGDTVHCLMISDYRCLLRDTAISPKTTIVVDTPVTPFLRIGTSAGTHIGPGQYDTLTAVVTEGGADPTYKWYVNNTAITDDTSDTYISNSFSAPYPDSITCVVTGSGACRMSTYTWVYIVVTSVGVNTLAAGEAMSIFPNPNNGEFTVQGSLQGINDAEVSLEITDILGRTVYKSKAMVQDGKINTRVVLASASTPAKAGMYLITISSFTESRTFQIMVTE